MPCHLRFRKFDKIFIDETRTVVGPERIDFITQGVANMMQEQLAAQQQRRDERQQQANREAWANTEFHEQIFQYDNIAIDTITFDSDGNPIIASGSNIQANYEVGELLNAPVPPNTEPKAIIIEDKNGDQWVVQKKDGGYKATKVPGGGLSPNMNTTVTDAAFDIVKRSLRSLRREYTDAKINEIRQSLASKRAELDRNISQNNSQYVPVTANTNSPQITSLLFDFEIETGTASNGESAFDRLSKETKSLELQVNRFTLISVIADNLDSREDYKLVARDLRIETKTVSEYITEQRAQNKTDDQLVQAVSQEIIALIDQIFIQYSNSQ